MSQTVGLPEGTPKIHGSSFSQFLNGNLGVSHPFLGGPNPSYPMKWLVVSPTFGCWKTDFWDVIKIKQNESKPLQYIEIILVGLPSGKLT